MSKNLCFSDVSIGCKRGTITSTGLILVVYKATKFYNPSVLKAIDSDTKPIYRRFGISNSVFSTLNWYFVYFNSPTEGQADEGGHIIAYSCERFGLYTFLLGSL